MICQYIYKPVLNFIYEKITSHINDRIKSEIMAACFFAISVVQFLPLYGWSHGLGISSDCRDVVIALIIAVVIALSPDGHLEIIKKWNLKIYIPFVLTGILIFVAGLDHYVGQSYGVLPLFMLFECICLYFVWGNRCSEDNGKYDVLFDAAAKGFAVFLAIMLVISITQFPQLNTDESYSIMNINPNGFVKLIAPGFVGCLYLMTRNTECLWRTVVYGLMAGMTTYLMIESGAIFATLILILVFAAWLIYYYRESEGVRSVIKVAIIVALSCALMCVVLRFVAPLYYHEPEPKPEPVAEKTVSDNDEQKEEIDWDKVPGCLAYVIAQGNEAMGDNPTLLALNEKSNGRIGIWLAYGTHLTPFGTDAKMYMHGAHNQFLQFAYSAGIFTGLAWLICAFFVGLRLLYRGVIKKNSALCFPTLAYLVFLVIAMLESGYMPLERTYLFMYLIIIVPTMFKVNSKIDNLSNNE